MRKVIGSVILTVLVLGFSGCSDTGKVAEESEIDRMVKEEFAKDAAKQSNKNANAEEIELVEMLIDHAKDRIKEQEKNILKATTKDGEAMMRRSIEREKQLILDLEERKRKL
jgi:AAA+ ATPase superfamily predicted ATPase